MGVKIRGSTPCTTPIAKGISKFHSGNTQLRFRRYALSVDKKPTEGWWDRRERSREGNTHGLVKVQTKKYPILEDMALIFDWKMIVVDKDKAYDCDWRHCSRELKRDKATIKLQADQELCVGHKDWKLYLTDCKHPVIPILEVKEVIIPNVKVNID